jgi:hypothetical protein
MAKKVGPEITSERDPGNPQGKNCKRREKESSLFGFAHELSGTGSRSFKGSDSFCEALAFRSPQTTLLKPI